MLEKLLNSGLILIQTRTEFMVEITQKFRLISHVEKLNPQFGQYECELMLKLLMVLLSDLEGCLFISE